MSNELTKVEPTSELCVSPVSREASRSALVGCTKSKSSRVLFIEEIFCGVAGINRENTEKLYGDDTLLQVSPLRLTKFLTHQPDPIVNRSQGTDLFF